MKIFLAATLHASEETAGEGSNWGTMDPKLCSIILSVWNHLPYTQQCLETLFRHTRGTFELIVINNGSTDATAEYLKNLHPDTPFIRGYKVITNPQNIGIACDLRLLKSGYRQMCLHKVVLYHYRELTRKHFQGTYKQENKKKFDLKYGLAPTDDWRKLANEIRGFKV